MDKVIKEQKIGNVRDIVQTIVFGNVIAENGGNTILFNIVYAADIFTFCITEFQFERMSIRGIVNLIIKDYKKFVLGKRLKK